MTREMPTPPRKRAIVCSTHFLRAFTDEHGCPPNIGKIENWTVVVDGVRCWYGPAHMQYHLRVMR